MILATGTQCFKEQAVITERSRKTRRWKSVQELWPQEMITSLGDSNLRRVLRAEEAREDVSR